jgi:hypothetical protein
MHILLFIIYFFATVNAENNSRLNENCYYLNSKSSCIKQSGCSWCNDANHDNSYSCSKTIDDCECVNQIDYHDCVKLTKCRYCNFGEYGGKYCISKAAGCV